VARFGSVAFGIYLAHLLLIKTCEAVATKLHWSISWQLDLLIFAVAAVGSTWLAWALARSRRTRWLVA
jgi:surface polysaccharide O-acyltransferase-like enzyme